MMANESLPMTGDVFAGVIKGIGKGMEGRLHDAAVLTYADLAALSPEEIAVILDGVIGMSPERIKNLDWVGQARNLVGKTPPPGNGFHYATFRVELTLTAEREVHRTRVFDNRKPEREPGKWSGWQEDRLTQFIMKQAGVKRPLPTPAPRTTTHENDLETGKTAVSQPVSPTKTAPSVATNGLAKLTIVEAQAFDSGQTTPTKIVRIHDDWGIQVKWALTEDQVLPQDMEWVISVYLESIGKKAQEYDLPVVKMQKSATNVIVEPDPTQQMDPGVYRLGIAMTGQSPSGDPLPIAAYRDGGMVHFFDAK